MKARDATRYAGRVLLFAGLALAWAATRWNRRPRLPERMSLLAIDAR